MQKFGHSSALNEELFLSECKREITSKVQVQETWGTIHPLSHGPYNWFTLVQDPKKL